MQSVRNKPGAQEVLRSQLSLLHHDDDDDDDDDDDGACTQMKISVLAKGCIFHFHNFENLLTFDATLICRNVLINLISSPQKHYKTNITISSKLFPNQYYNTSSDQKQSQN